MSYWTDYQLPPGFSRGDIVRIRQPDSRHPRNQRWWREFLSNKVWRVQRMHNRRQLHLAEWPAVQIVEEQRGGRYENIFVPFPWVRHLTPLEILAASTIEPEIVQRRL